MFVGPKAQCYIQEQRGKFYNTVLEARALEDKGYAEREELSHRMQKRNVASKFDKKIASTLREYANNYLKDLLHLHMNCYFDVKRLMEPIHFLNQQWHGEIVRRTKIILLRNEFAKKANIIIPLTSAPSRCVNAILESKEYNELLNFRMSRFKLLRSFEVLGKDFDELLLAENETPMDSSFFSSQFEDMMSRLNEINQSFSVIKGRFIQKVYEIEAQYANEVVAKDAATFPSAAANGPALDAASAIHTDVGSKLDANAAAHATDTNARPRDSNASNQEVPLTFNIDERKLHAEVREQYKPDALRKTWEMKVSADKKQNAAERKQRLDSMLEPTRRQVMLKHKMQAMRELSPDEVKRREERVRKFISVPRIHQLLVHLYSSPKTFGVDELTALIHALQTQGEKIRLKNRDGSHFAYEFRVAANYGTLDGSGFGESLFGFNQKGSQKGFPDNIVANLQSTFTRAGYTKAMLGLEDNIVKRRKLTGKT